MTRVCVCVCVHVCMCVFVCSDDPFAIQLYFVHFWASHAAMLLQSCDEIIQNVMWHVLSVWDLDKFHMELEKVQK